MVSGCLQRARFIFAEPKLTSCKQSQGRSLEGRMFYTTSLQKRRNSQVTQRLCEVGGGGIVSVSMTFLICLRVCPTFLRSCGVREIGSACRNVIE